MRQRIVLVAVLAIVLVTPFTVSGAVINGLFTTGVDGTGNALAAGAADPHYSILSPAQPAIVVRDSIPGGWVPNGANHRWVWQTVNGTPTNTTLTFRTTFDLTGLDPATATITGQWSSDNYGLNILVNNAGTGQTSPGYWTTTGFSINSGFVSGVNTLDFVVQDVGAISGFLVTSISGTADELNPVPEPATVCIWGVLAGLAVAATGRRRRTN